MGLIFSSVFDLFYKFIYLLFWLQLFPKFEWKELDDSFFACCKDFLKCFFRYGFSLNGFNDYYSAKDPLIEECSLFW
jgi:hypothetical protein